MMHFMVKNCLSALAALVSFLNQLVYLWNIVKFYFCKLYFSDIKKKKLEIGDIGKGMRWVKSRLGIENKKTLWIIWNPPCCIPIMILTSSQWNNHIVIVPNLIHSESLKINTFKTLTDYFNGQGTNKIYQNGLSTEPELVTGNLPVIAGRLNRVN